MNALTAFRDMWRYVQAHQAGMFLGSLVVTVLVAYLALLIVTTYEIKLLWQRRIEAQIAREAFDIAWMRLARRLGARQYRRAIFYGLWPLWLAYRDVMKNSWVGRVGLALLTVVGSVWLAVLGIWLSRMTLTACDWLMRGSAR
jgi:hypothetical protein